MNRHWRKADEGDAAWDNRLLKMPDAKVTWTAFGASQYPAVFDPDHAPQRVEALGAFGGMYWAGEAGEERSALLRDYLFGMGPIICTWSTRTKRESAAHNFFGANSGMTRGEWLDRGWIFDFDPLGWHEWHWWFLAGRRIAGYDEWQIRRWARFKDRKMRAYAATPTPAIAQSLLHWGIRPEAW